MTDSIQSFALADPEMFKRGPVIRLTKLGVETLVNPFSITICFPAPTLRLICKYALVTSVINT